MGGWVGGWLVRIRFYSYLSPAWLGLRLSLAKPLEILWNRIIKSGVWPEQWKTEYTTPIGKIPVPECEDDLRPISLTLFFSKVMEHFVVLWLLDIFGHKLDFRQYGGLKGNLINHYFISSSTTKIVLSQLLFLPVLFTSVRHSITRTITY